jgi:hypothetical protein
MATVMVVSIPALMMMMSSCQLRLSLTWSPLSRVPDQQCKRRGQARPAGTYEACSATPWHCRCYSSLEVTSWLPVAAALTVLPSQVASATAAGRGHNQQQNHDLNTRTWWLEGPGVVSDSNPSQPPGSGWWNPSHHNESTSSRPTRIRRRARLTGRLSHWWNHHQVRVIRMNRQAPGRLGDAVTVATENLTWHYYRARTGGSGY